MLESRLMAEAWAFTRTKLPPILRGPPLEIWMQRTYYVGARHVLTQLMDDASHLDENDDLSVTDKDRVAALFAEIDAFLASDVARNEHRDTDVQ